MLEAVASSPPAVSSPARSPTDASSAAIRPVSSGSCSRPLQQPLPQSPSRCTHQIPSPSGEYVPCVSPNLLLIKDLRRQAARPLSALTPYKLKRLRLQHAKDA